MAQLTRRKCNLLAVILFRISVWRALPRVRSQHVIGVSHRIKEGSAAFSMIWIGVLAFKRFKLVLRLHDRQRAAVQQLYSRCLLVLESLLTCIFFLVHQCES